MNALNTFIRKNRLITAFFVVSVIIIVSYILMQECPELFDGTETIFNLLFQLSIGYIINFMFYITQVYIPTYGRNEAVKKCIAKRIDTLINKMERSISALVPLYVGDHSGEGYTDAELNALLNLRFSDEVHYLNPFKTRIDNRVYYNVKEWISICIADAEKDIDNLFKYYAAEFSMNLMEILEEIMHSKYHTTMKYFTSIPGTTDFSKSTDPIFVEYYSLIQKLQEIRKTDY